MRLARNGEARPLVAQLHLGAADQLAAGCLALADRAGDVRVVGVEHLAQQEGRTRLGGQTFQQHQEGHRQIVGPLGQLLRGGGRLRQFGLRQPDAGVVLALDLGHAQPVDRQSRGDGDQPGLGVVDAAAVGLMPTQPGVLHHILGFRDRAEHPIGDAVQARPQPGERQRGGIGRRGRGGRVGPVAGIG